MATRTDQVKAGILDKIRTGVYPLGQPIPSTKALEAEYGFSQTTVRAAVRDLRLTRILEGEPSVAVYVRSLPDLPEYGSVLAEPPSFPATRLEGYWVTSYDFTHAGGQKVHADVARITAVSDRRVTIANHPPDPRSEGRAFPFLNEIQALLVNRHLIGHWRNTSDTRYFGGLQLAVMPGETVMDGFYTGFGSDILVSMGQWKWVRLASVPDSMAGVILREPAAIRDLIMPHSANDAPLALADIREESS